VEVINALSLAILSESDLFCSERWLESASQSAADLSSEDCAADLVALRAS